jgi:hypothetical protein
MKYEIRGKNLKAIEFALKDFTRETTPLIEKEIEKADKKLRSKYKELKGKKVTKPKIEFTIKRYDNFIFFEDVAPTPTFMKKRAGKKMAKFLENTLKDKVPDVEVKWIKGD